MNAVKPRSPKRVVVQSWRSPGPLQRDALERIDASDCWATPVRADDTTSPSDWNRAILGHSPRWVSALMGIRNVIAKMFRLQAPTKDQLPQGFPVVALGHDEILVGTDDSHLSFRVGIVVVNGTVFVTTTVQIHNWVGRGYWFVVRWFHPPIVRAMIRRAPRVQALMNAAVDA